LERWRLWYKQ